MLRSEEKKFKPFIQELIRQEFPDNNLPRFYGIFLFGNCIVLMNDPTLLQDIYLTKNKFFSKHPMKSEGSAPLFYNDIVTMGTDNPQYLTKRKALSSAFFKNKVLLMTKVVKQTTLDTIRDLTNELKDKETGVQKEGTNQDRTSINVDIVMFTKKLQSNIMTNILLGDKSDQITLTYKNKQSDQSQASSLVPIHQFIDQMIKDMRDRVKSNPLLAFNPKWNEKKFTKEDERFHDNCTTFRSFVKELIQKRKDKQLKGLSVGTEGQKDENSDMIGQLLNDSMYCDKIDDIIDDIIIMFIAGTATVQGSTTNLLTQLTQNP